MIEVGHRPSIAPPQDGAPPERGVPRLRVLTASVVLTLAVAVCTALPSGTATGAAAGVVAPPGWPATLQLGMSSPPGDAADVRATAAFGLRSQYLAGGVNTGSGWATWNPNGTFVTNYAQESQGLGLRSVFDYYMLLQSLPATGANESAKLTSNLNNAATMTAYYNDLKLFFQRAAPIGNSVVLHMEPDLWGYLEQRASGDDASTVTGVRVASTGLSDLAGLPDTASGLAQAVLRLRDRYGPGVQVAYHASVWGTGNDILYSKPSDATVDALGTRAGTFYLSLGAAFDLAFTDPSDRDAAFKQFQYGDGGASWWSSADYARNVRWLSRFYATTGKALVMWQVPLGNTKMTAMNNTWNHYQDNHVEWLIDDPGRTHLADYVSAGVVAIIFGRGADGATCACDANADGVTNPAPINGNTIASLNADDDGGFFRAKASQYYAAGALPLTGGVPTTPPPSPTASPPPATPPPSPTASPPPVACVPSEGPGIPAPPSVASGISGLHAAWYGQSGYPTLCVGQRSTATVAFYNSGSTGWVSGRMGEVAYLGTWGPEPGQDRVSPLGGDGQLGSPNTGWPRYNRIAVQPAQYVGPGQIAWFQFTIQAPTTPGTYRLYLRPLIEGASWLEDYGVFWLVTVR
ncbi:MAG TPA: hypothetical protein VI056_09170 [Candidatus Limnocylindria bacterium]